MIASGAFRSTVAMKTSGEAMYILSKWTKSRARMLAVGALSATLIGVSSSVTAQDFARLQRLSSEISDLTVNLPADDRRASAVVRGIRQERDAFCNQGLPQCDLAQDLAASAENSLQQIRRAIQSQNNEAAPQNVATGGDLNRLNRLSNEIVQIASSAPQNDDRASAVVRGIRQERDRFCAQQPQGQLCLNAQNLTRQAENLLAQIRQAIRNRNELAQINVAPAGDLNRLNRLSNEIVQLAANTPQNDDRASAIVRGIRQERDAFCGQQPQGQLCINAQNLTTQAENLLGQIRQAIQNRGESALQTALNTSNRVNQIANRVEQDRATAFNRTGRTNRIEQLRVALLANPPQTEPEALRRFREINQERFSVCNPIPNTAPDCQFANSVVREARLILTQIRSNNASIELGNVQQNDQTRSLRQELQLVGLTPEQVPAGLLANLRSIVQRRNNVCGANPFTPQCNTEQQNVANARNEVAAILSN